MLISNIIIEDRLTNGFIDKVVSIKHRYSYSNLSEF